MSCCTPKTVEIPIPSRWPLHPHSLQPQSQIRHLCVSVCVCGHFLYYSRSQRERRPCVSYHDFYYISSHIALLHKLFISIYVCLSFLGVEVIVLFTDMWRKYVKIWLILFFLKLIIDPLLFFYDFLSLNDKKHPKTKQKTESVTG